MKHAFTTKLLFSCLLIMFYTFQAKTQTITNADFETGDYTGWTTSNASKTDIDGVNQYEGSYCLWLKGPQNIRNTVTGLIAETEYMVTIYVTHPDYGVAEGFTSYLFFDDGSLDAEIDSVVVDSTFKQLSGIVTTGIGQTDLTVGVRNGGFFHAFYDLLEVSEVVPVTGVSLDITSQTLEVGETVDLTPTLEPANATVKTVSWSSSDETVATVNDTGLVTAVAGGSATITATTDYGDLTATCDITVNPPVSGITIENPGFETGDYTGWTTSNASKTAIDTENQYEGSYCLWLKGPQNIRTTVTGLTAETEYAVSIYLTHPDYGKQDGHTSLLFYDDNGTDVDIDSIIVDSSFNQIVSSITTGVGQTELTIGVRNGGFFHSFIDMLEVIEATPVTGVSLNTNSGTLEVGETLELIAIVEPANATIKTVSWSSSDETVATVNDTGLVTALAGGSATITATTESGGQTATCDITVNAAQIAVTGVSLDITSDTLDIDETLNLVATVEPADATNKTITWSSSDVAVATVNDGLVTAISAGTATITVTTEDGDFTASCEIIVNQVLGINKAQYKLEVFPIPTSSSLSITSELNIRSVIVYNLVGKPQVITSNSNSKHVVIDTNVLSSGIYIVSCELENGYVINKRIIKQ